jgi:hypothetical protein
MSLKGVHIFVFTGLFMLTALSSCTKDEFPDPVKKSSFNLEIVSGNNQTGNNTKFLKDSIVFRVTDLNQVSVPGRRVDFKILSGGGFLDSDHKVTDNNGLVYIKWRVGTGTDDIIKATIFDDEGIAANQWALANSDVDFDTRWTSGIRFYRNFKESMTHDNKILETNHFLIFSNASTDDNKVIFAKIAEEHLLDLINWFNISYADLRINPDDKDTKLKIYAHTNTNQPGAWSGVKNYGILFSAYGSPGWISNGLKHELTHIVQLLIIGPENCIGSFPPPWFTEGIAEYFGRNVSSCPSPIDNLSELNGWKQTHKNPVSIIEYSDMGESRWCEYYTMFGLALNYLLDPTGGNINCEQVKQLYKDIAVNKNFNLSFEQNFNISVTEFENDLYDLLTNYLSVK